MALHYVHGTHRSVPFRSVSILYWYNIVHLITRSTSSSASVFKRPVPVWAIGYLLPGGEISYWSREGRTGGCSSPCLSFPLCSFSNAEDKRSFFFYINSMQRGMIKPLHQLQTSITHDCHSTPHLNSFRLISGWKSSGSNGPLYSLLYCNNFHLFSLPTFHCLYYYMHLFLV